MRPALLAEGKRALPTAGKLAINLDKYLGVQQRAVLDAPRPIDAVALAKSIKTVLLSGVLSSRKRQRVDDTLHADRLAPQPCQLCIHEAYIEFGVVDDEPRIADEGEKFVNDACEDRLVLKDGGGMAVDARGVLGDLALGIDERMEDLSRQDLMDNFDRANFQHPVSVAQD